MSLEKLSFKCSLSHEAHWYTAELLQMQCGDTLLRPMPQRSFKRGKDINNNKHTLEDLYNCKITFHKIHNYFSQYSREDVIYFFPQLITETKHIMNVYLQWIS